MKTPIALLLLLTAVMTASANRHEEVEPWVKNVSQPYKLTKGLQGRHIALWASHGCYYDLNEGQWRWQRPFLFGTTEDLYTQTIVVPYLIPMLENAGAVVFTPRERDWQWQEAIVDNDDKPNLTNYREEGIRHPWKDAGVPGFAYHRGAYSDGENPFLAGTARMAQATDKKHHQSLVSYQPTFPKQGSYAVYVSYATLPNSVNDAHYTVWHRGQKTEFRVNQQMGGSTWVYLGTFDFDEGSDAGNRVTLSNISDGEGVVTTDAVRFGGGMGNMERGGQLSGYPRALEGARYWAQWAGMPYHVYSSKAGRNDYADDINVRSLMLNYLAGGSSSLPDSTGLHVPIEVSVAVHSDAGYQKDGSSIYGSLGICTTNNNGRYTLGNGKPREASKKLAQQMLDNLQQDLSHQYGQWCYRHLYDRNYSETRNPEVPSVIIETLSHQSFPDMRYGQDPNFRFAMARSIYKTIARFLNSDCDIAPLTPTHLKAEFTDKRGELLLSWQDAEDLEGAAAKPTDYIVYIAGENGEFDNGRQVGKPSYRIRLEPGKLYSFRVAALNKGGRSFPSETLSALYEPGATKTILIVNGFHRLSSPAVVYNDSLQGFDLAHDIGVTYGPTYGWSGQQKIFQRNKMGIEDSTGLGYSGNEMAGLLFAGNDMNYVVTHAKAIETAHRYNIVSCAAEAVEQGQIQLSHYAMTDLLLGLECDDLHSLVYYKSIKKPMRQKLEEYTRQGGRLLVSGAYIGSDMTRQKDDHRFLRNVLKCWCNGSSTITDEQISGMGTTFDFYRQLNAEHYAATRPDMLFPIEPAFSALLYADGQSACVAYPGKDYRALTLGFPFECIKSDNMRAAVMQGILNFLFNNQ